MNTLMKEGTWHDFVIMNIIMVPGEGEHLVLLSGNQSRFLLPATPYQQYGFEKDMRIRCRIDKINCNGKVYLEPAHPLYRQGQSYDFEFIRQETRYDQAGNPIPGWIFPDSLGNEIFTPVRPGSVPPDPGNPVTCEVSRIKNARLSLTHAWSAVTTAVEPSLSYPFKVICSGKDRNDKSGWILEGPDSMRAFIDGESFGAYGIRTGIILKCRIIKWHPQRGWIIEPEHPFYREGMLYSFKIKEIKPLEIDQNMCIVMVEDMFQQLISFPLEIKNASLPENGTDQIFRVVSMRKGKPVLALP